MNAAERFEIESIREDQKRVHRLVDSLDRRIDLLDQQFAVPAPALAPVPEAPPPLPIERPEVRQAAIPPPVMAAPVQFPAPEPPPKPSEPFADAPEPATDVAEPSAEPLELRVGTYWMARIGIAILLTGFVFLGNYAYHRVIALLGACGKLTLLALAGGALAGLGVWLEKKSESLRNYGRVLLAGGAATIYYTTYAAHFVAGLRVIENALLGGTLLLTLAGGILWFAERRRSESTALLTVLLSYYTAAINSIGAFTLFSNLLLTAVAVVFLVRQRWTRLPIACLVATYGSYGFWRFQQFAQFGTTSDFGLGPGFLAGYWVLFTAAVFLAAPGVWKAVERAGFLTLNNGIFFAFAAHHFALHRAGAFGTFALIYGIVLLGLAALAARRHREEPAMDGAYLAQGLAIVTIGFAAKLTGPQLSVVLAVESAALLGCGRSRHAWLYQIAAGLCALGAYGLALTEIQNGTASPIALGGTVAALLLVDAWWVKWLRGEWRERHFTPHALGFAALGLLLAAHVLSQVVPAPWLPMAYALATVVGLLALFARMPEIALPTQFFVLWGALLSIGQCLQTLPPPWWTPLPVVAVSLTLMHWWQHPRSASDAAMRASLALLFALTATFVGALWLRAFAQGDTWLATTSAIAVGALVYGLATRAWPLALAGQIFQACSLAAFLGGISNGYPYWLAALGPVLSMIGAGLLLTRFAAARWPSPAAEWSVADLAPAYRAIGAIMFAAWSFKYVSADLRVPYFASLGAAQILAGSYGRALGRIISGALYAGAALLMFWVKIEQPVTGLDLLAILAVPAAFRLGARYAGEKALWPAAQKSLVAFALASVWMWVTRWTIAHVCAGQLTTAWALLALVVLGTGLGLRERLYRLGGFTILTLAVGRLFIVDVWRFDTLFRIVSFIVLGGVLLALSFVYHRFAELLRRWL